MFRWRHNAGHTQCARVLIQSHVAMHDETASSQSHDAMHTKTPSLATLLLTAMAVLSWSFVGKHFNTLRPRQNGRHFPDDIFKCIFLNGNVLSLIMISLKFVPKGPINNIPALVQIMAWRRLGDKPLSEPMLVSLLTHICVHRLQWVKDTPKQGNPLKIESPIG